jgi:guanosine-3',5'-bis(diphosphate) 3'-pyrophosphohydrolase
MRVFGSWRDWSAARRGLGGRLPPAAVAALGEAFEFARVWHGDQVRPGGEPYATHLLEVLEIAVEVGGCRDVDALRAAVLHDVVEDTLATVEQVRARFGADTAELVGWLTAPEPGAGEDPGQARARYLARFVSAPDVVRLIKLCDRYSSVQRLDTHPRPARRRSYYLETREHLLPLAASTPGLAELFAEWDRNFRYLADDPGTS